jgi:hypothetical protein
MINSKSRDIGLQSLSIILLGFIYYWIGYEVQKTQFSVLLSLYFSAFLLSYYLFKCGLSLRKLIGLSFLFKLIFLFSIPELSQDFYRFIWDGMLNTNGYNPYLHLPVDLIKEGTIQNESISLILLEGMGSLNATNFSTYPPVAQLVYTISYALGGSSLLLNIICLRLFNILAEIGLVWFSLKVLDHLKLPGSHILFFILNPLVIIESSFNLHFEVIMLFFLVLSLYYLMSTRLYLSAIGLAGAVVSKMLPLMFLPLFFSYFNKKKNRFNRGQVLRYCKFLGVLGLGIAISYISFLNVDILSKSSQTLSLYFTSFEFNASIYYVLRQVGFWWSGYNQIQIIGTSLSVLTLFVILYLSFKRSQINSESLITFMLFASTGYYLLATTVHPWYLMLPLFLSIFTTYKYMLVWSCVVFLSYSAYKIDGVEENNLWLWTEYILVIGTIIYEFSPKSKKLKL